MTLLMLFVLLDDDDDDIADDFPFVDDGGDVDIIGDVRFDARVGVLLFTSYMCGSFPGLSGPVNGKECF